MALEQFLETGLLVSVIVPWIVGLFAGLIALWTLFRRVSFFKDKPLAAAHQVVVVVPFVFLSVVGTWIWFFDPDYVEAFKEDKVYGNYPPCLRLVCVMFAFQVWDFCTTIVMSREVKGQAQHIAHHASSALLSGLGLISGPHGFLTYFAPFFFGISEISSIPLAFMDLFKYSKELTATYPQTNEAVRISFAALFLLARCIYWPIVCVNFWITTLTHEGIPLWLEILWYFFNISLTLLQFYWGSLIIKGIIKKLKGGRSDQAREAGEALYPEAVEVSRSGSEIQQA